MVCDRLSATVRHLKEVKFKHCIQSYHFIYVPLEMITSLFRCQYFKRWSPVARKCQCYSPLKSMISAFQVKMPVKHYFL